MPSGQIRYPSLVLGICFLRTLRVSPRRRCLRGTWRTVCYAPRVFRGALTLHVEDRSLKPRGEAIDCMWVPARRAVQARGLSPCLASRGDRYRDLHKRRARVHAVTECTRAWLKAVRAIGACWAR